MNIIESIEKIRYGRRVPIPDKLLYSRLKCLADESFHDFTSHPNEPLSLCPVFSCRFCNVPSLSHLLAVCNEEGKVVFHDCKKTSSKPVKFSLQAHNNAIFDIMWANSEAKLVTASGDHSCGLFDVTESSVKPIFRFLGHQRCAKVLSAKPDDNYIFASGGRDGFIIQWDIRSNKGTETIHPDRFLKLAHIPLSKEAAFKCAKKNNWTTDLEMSISSSITGLVYQDGNTLISSSSGDGLIKIWDMRKTYTTNRRRPTPLEAIKYPGTNDCRSGYTYLTLSPCKLKLFANCTDGTIYCFNAGTYSSTPIAQYKGHGFPSFYIKNGISPNGRYISCGSADHKAYIWSVDKPKNPPMILSGHLAEVTCVDWHNGNELLMATCSDDSSYRIWRVDTREVNSEFPKFDGFSSICPQTCSVENSVEIDSSNSGSLSRNSDDGTEFLPNGDSQDSESNDALSERGANAEKENILQTPTKGVRLMVSDLPSFAIDGTSPHSHICTRSPASCSDSGDWLTRLRKNTPPTKKLTRSGQKRKLEESVNRSPRPSARGNLLKFFKSSVHNTPWAGNEFRETKSDDLETT